ncbi:ABC transporter substrate-binding protein [Deinococcus frigens]|uniref:ABC transporter substrate-binding protein n=1 Tax=Deinococcus frigens TaxID=249403 RepID=UPI00068BE82E|nr:ABC transporter substrate-binding protein [Deinococcus frigens]
MPSAKKSSSRASILGAAALLTLLLGAAQTALAQNKAPIKIGAISSLTGAAVFPESSQAAKAVFDRVNAAGGIGGRMIEYISEDDKFDPAGASQAARRLIDDEGVVALAGSASPIECNVNAAFYAQRSVLSVSGVGIDTKCFTSANIAPVNVGPYSEAAAAMYYASNTLKRGKVCFVGNANPAQNAGYDGAVARWEKLSGQKLALLDRTLRPGDDLTPTLLKVQRAGCEAVIFSGVEPQVVAWMNAASTQKIKGIDFIMLSAAYTDRLAKALGNVGNGMYAISAFEPFSGSAGTLTDWHTLMNASKVPLNSFSQAGYVAANVMVDALKKVKGEITRQSVTAALRGLKNYRSPLMGSAYTFGSGANNPNQSVKIVRLRGGQWVTVNTTWLRLPAAGQ